MAVNTTKQELQSRSYREPSEFSAPQYNITYRHDHTLQWEPAVGSKELAVALSYHFPLQTNLESKMQAATRKFLREEDSSNQDPSRETTIPIDTKDTCLEARSTLGPLQIFTWDSEMKEYNPKTKRRRYDTKERVKVAQNRGFACEQHRRMKMKCDPERCPRNKQRLGNTGTVDLLPSIEHPPRQDMETGEVILDFSSPLQDPECAQLQSDALSLNSFAPSEVSHRWSVSSFVPSIETYMSAEFSTNGQQSDAASSMHDTGAGSHNSIDSIVLSEHDLNVLANCESLDYNIDQNGSNTWWANNAHGAFISEEPQDQPSIHAQISETFLTQPAEVIDGDISLPLDQYTDFGNFTENTSQDVEDGSMEWEFARVANTIPDYEGQDIIPLTDEQKDTLVKWWGRDRLTEAPSSLFGRSNSSRPPSSQNRSSASDNAIEAGGNIGRKNTLVDRVKAVRHVPPFIRRSLERSRSVGRDRALSK